jgi:hypothetical protein
LFKGVSIVVKEKLEIIEPEVGLSDCLKCEIQIDIVMPSTSSLNLSIIQWYFVASSYCKVVDGVLLYTFAAESDLCCHQKLGER